MQSEELPFIAPVSFNQPVETIITAGDASLRKTVFQAWPTASGSTVKNSFANKVKFSYMFRLYYCSVDSGSLYGVQQSAECDETLTEDAFVDFADEEDSTLISQEILDSHPYLYVMKSISKSYGVPGLRLGVLASGDTGTVALMKKDVAIWNINSFAEFYMQIAEKYKNDYATGLQRLRAERDRFERELARIPGLRVIPSQANFIMVETAADISPKELLKALMIRHNLLIKDLTAKTNGGNYLRIAVRNTEDNNALLNALKAELH